MRALHARVVTSLIVLLCLYGCGGGGTSFSRNDASTSGYDVAAQIAAIRAHPGYGAYMSNGGNPNAPQGLMLPAPPGCPLTEVTVTSTAQFNTEAAATCKRIILAPSAIPYSGDIRIDGQDIEAVFTGTTITPPDGNTRALRVTQSARRVKTIGGTFNNAFAIGGRTDFGTVRHYAQDVHIYGATFNGLYTQGLSPDYLGDGATILAHRFLLERSSGRSASGTFFIEGGSTNLIMANCNFVVPKLAQHENPVRANGADLVVIMDSRLRTELGAGQGMPIKHTWRMHASLEGAGDAGGRMLVLRVQSEGGGAMAQYPGVEGPDPQSTRLIVHGWRYYRADDVEGNNIAAFPHLNTDPMSAYVNDEMNEAVWMDDNIVYSNGAAAGSNIMGANAPPGPITNSVYASYVDPPAWDFR